MKKSRILLILVFAGLNLISCNKKEVEFSDPLVTNRDTLVNPADDFFKYANGGWFKKNPIPSTEQSNGIFRTIADTINNQIKQICEKSALDESAQVGSNKQKIGDFYASGMDSIAINKAGISALKSEFAKIDAIKDIPSLVISIAHLHTIGASPAFSFYIGQDDKISTKYALFLGQGGLGLGNRDYYFNTDEPTVKIRTEYVKHLQAMLKLIGQNEAGATSIMKLETDLAKASRKLEDLRDPVKNYNKMTVASLGKITSNINWNSIFPVLGVAKADSVIVGQPEFYKTLNTFVKSYSIEDWKTYLKWDLVNSYAPYLNSTIEKQNFKFYSTVMNGVAKQKPRWKRVVGQTDAYLGELIGQVYVAEYLPKGSKEKLLEIGNNIRDVYADHIKKLDWMSAATKVKALNKLSKIVMKVGYPDKWKDMSSMKIDRKSYCGNVIQANIWGYKDMVNKYGKPVDRTEWSMQPQTYNAYYNPSNNPEDLFITALAPIDSAMLVGTYSGKIFEFKKNKFKLIDSSSKSGDCVYKIVPINKNEYWFCEGTRVVHYKDKKSTSHYFSFPTTEYTQSYLLDSRGNLWFANLNTLSIFKNNKFKEIITKGVAYDQFVTLSEDKNNIIWVGTFGNGLLKYDGENFTNISITNGLCDNFISSSYYDKSKNILWIGTMNGISKINLDDKSNIKSITNIINNPNSDSYGCVQNAIDKLPNGNIIISIGEELYEYDYKRENKTNTQLKLSLQGIKINYQKLNLDGFFKVDYWSNVPLNLTLPFNNNNISFDFIAIDYNNPHSLKYTWKLEGIEKDWSPLTQNNYASFTNLPGGNYTFRLKAINEDNEISNEIIYVFEITPPFYQTWWFIPVLLIVLFSTAILNNRYQIKKIKAQEIIKTENFKRLAELELKAMRAQMNPHFMFNTLNSIQEIVLNKDDITARIYLADFALMMRMILENSTQKEISFEKELEFLKLYLKMEELRFENKFEISLNIPDELYFNNIKIPPMLIQPYIENAISHGLMHKTEKGLLTISFEIEFINDTECLKCTVLDNGIGRKKAKEYSAWKEKKHQSMATEITNERLQLLNSIHTKKGFQVIITDLENLKNESIGTKIELYIPIN